MIVRLMDTSTISQLVNTVQYWRLKFVIARETKITLSLHSHILLQCTEFSFSLVHAFLPFWECARSEFVGEWERGGGGVGYNLLDNRSLWNVEYGRSRKNKKKIKNLLWLQYCFQVYRHVFQTTNIRKHQTLFFAH